MDYLRFSPSTWLWAVFVFGCAGANQAGPNSPSADTSAGEAAITAGAAAALWVAGGGCRLQGCPYGSFCNKDTGLCEAKRCSEGCPDGTVCNEGLNRCQMAPPPNTPNDFLPEDDARYEPGQ